MHLFIHHHKHIRASDNRNVRTTCAKISIICYHNDILFTNTYKRTCIFFPVLLSSFFFRKKTTKIFTIEEHKATAINFLSFVFFIEIKQRNVHFSVITRSNIFIMVNKQMHISTTMKNFNMSLHDVTNISGSDFFFTTYSKISETSYQHEMLFTRYKLSCIFSYSEKYSLWGKKVTTITFSSFALFFGTEIRSQISSTCWHHSVIR